MMKITIFLTTLLSAGCSPFNNAAQTIDLNYNPVIIKPAYEKEAGPKVYIDEGHNNYHTMNGMYKPFADLLINDGYRVEPIKKRFSKDSLSQVDILVIVNAIHKDNIDSWSLPVLSAFTDEEIFNVNKWVNNGGSLWLIVDHMPLSGAAKKLATSFGFLLNNGHAHGPDGKRHIRFSLKNQTLIDNEITNGLRAQEQIQSVYTYSGDAFKIPDDAVPLLVFEKGSYSLNPEKAFNFEQETQRIDISGWSHGAAKKYGAGKIVLLGESGAFTAQILGKQKQKVGLNSADAPYNQQFILNLAHWLSGN